MRHASQLGLGERCSCECGLSSLFPRASILSPLAFWNALRRSGRGRYFIEPTPPSASESPTCSYPCIVTARAQRCDKLDAWIDCDQPSARTLEQQLRNCAKRCTAQPSEQCLARSQPTPRPAKTESACLPRPHPASALRRVLCGHCRLLASPPASETIRFRTSRWHSFARGHCNCISFSLSPASRVACPVFRLGSAQRFHCKQGESRSSQRRVPDLPFCNASALTCPLCPATAMRLDARDSVGGMSWPRQR
jgi:hypothetical protein